MRNMALISTLCEGIEKYRNVVIHAEESGNGRAYLYTFRDDQTIGNERR